MIVRETLIHSSDTDVLIDIDYTVGVNKVVVACDEIHRQDRIGFDTICVYSGNPQSLNTFETEKKIQPLIISNVGLTLRPATNGSPDGQRVISWHLRFNVTSKTESSSKSPPKQTGCFFEWLFDDAPPSFQTIVRCDNPRFDFYIYPGSWRGFDGFELVVIHTLFDGGHYTPYPAPWDIRLIIWGIKGFSNKTTARCELDRCEWVEDGEAMELRYEVEMKWDG